MGTIGRRTAGKKLRTKVSDTISALPFGETDPSGETDPPGENNRKAA